MPSTHSMRGNLREAVRKGDRTLGFAPRNKDLRRDWRGPVPFSGSLGCFAIVLIGLALVPAARADVKIDELTKKATAKALEWLAARQNSDGSFSDGRYVHDTAMTSFALLAFMSQGHLPAQGKYGPEVNKAARFLMAAAKPHKVQIEGK